MKLIKWLGLAVVVLGLGVVILQGLTKIVAVVQSGPVISSIGGFTSSNAGISNGVVGMSCGRQWNGWRVIFPDNSTEQRTKCSDCISQIQKRWS